MADAKKSKSAPSTSSTGKRGEFVNEAEDAQEAGYWGTRDNPHADEEFSLQTGPDAPVTDVRGNPVDTDELESEQKEIEKRADESEKQSAKREQSQ